MSTSIPANDNRRWALLGGTLLFTFLVLGFFGREVYRQAPPIPERVVTPDGATVMTKDDILTGQQVWQSTGGQQLGSIWGHGAYQAPDWSADWLHREASALLDVWAETEGAKDFASLSPRPAGRAPRRGSSARCGRTRSTPPREPSRSRPSGPRRCGASPPTTTPSSAATPRWRRCARTTRCRSRPSPTPARRKALTAFFFWTSWAATTERPGQSITYTNNWPHEPLVENVPSGANVVWSLVSIVLLLAGIGAARLVDAPSARRRSRRSRRPRRTRSRDSRSRPRCAPAASTSAPSSRSSSCRSASARSPRTTPSRGRRSSASRSAQWLPYALTRTWHVQTGVFWIATAFLAAGLFLAPVIGGHEPKFQRLGVNVLFGALLVVVAGSLTGEYLAIHQVLPLDLSFWFGHQGYEYVDLGRVWQIALFVGLILWLVLMLRAILPGRCGAATTPARSS